MTNAHIYTVAAFILLELLMLRKDIGLPRRRLSEALGVFWLFCGLAMGLASL